MASHMKEVAKILDVELGIPFEVNGYSGLYVLTHDGLCHVESQMWSEGLLVRLLAGENTIKRKPWKPHVGERYYYTDGHHILDVEWKNYIRDWNAYKLGNCYRDQKSAEADREKWIEFYASDEVLEV